jgi:hypothetical protein
MRSFLIKDTVRFRHSLFVAVFGIGFRRASGFHRLLQQFRALLIKHVIHSARNIILTIVQLALPVIFTIIACIIEKTIIAPTDPPPLPLNLSYFAKPIIPVSTDSNLHPEIVSLNDSYWTVAGAWGAVNDTAGQNMDMHLLNIASDLYRYNRDYIVAGWFSATASAIT